MQFQSTLDGFQTTETMGMQQQSTQANWMTSPCSLGDFLANLSALLGGGQGFNDTRGTLFFEIARVLADKRPQYFLLENVKGLLSNNKGETFKTILGVFDELGYDVLWETHNSKNYGVPQNRERLFLKGYFREQCGREILSAKKKARELMN